MNRFSPDRVCKPRILSVEVTLDFNHITSIQQRIAHFTVTVGNEAGVDLVLIGPFLLHYVNQVVVMLTSVFKQNLH